MPPLPRACRSWLLPGPRDPLAQLEFLEDDLQLLPFDKLKAPRLTKALKR